MCFVFVFFLLLQLSFPKQLGTFFKAIISSGCKVTPLIYLNRKNTVCLFLFFCAGEEGLEEIIK